MADLMERSPPSSGMISEDFCRRDWQLRQSIQSGCQDAPQTLQKWGAVGIEDAAAAGSSMGRTWRGSTLSGSMGTGLLPGNGGGQTVGSFSAVKTPPRDFWLRSTWRFYCRAISAMSLRCLAPAEMALARMTMMTISSQPMPMPPMPCRISADRLTVAMTLMT